MASDLGGTTGSTVPLRACRRSVRRPHRRGVARPRPKRGGPRLRHAVRRRPLPRQGACDAAGAPAPPAPRPMPALAVAAAVTEHAARRCSGVLRRLPRPRRPGEGGRDPRRALRRPARASASAPAGASTSTPRWASRSTLPARGSRSCRRSVSLFKAHCRRETTSDRVPTPVATAACRVTVQQPHPPIDDRRRPAAGPLLRSAARPTSSASTTSRTTSTPTAAHRRTSPRTAERARCATQPVRAPAELDIEASPFFTEVTDEPDVAAARTPP